GERLPRRQPQPALLAGGDVIVHRQELPRRERAAPILLGLPFGEMAHERESLPQRYPSKDDVISVGAALCGRPGWVDSQGQNRPPPRAATQGRPYIHYPPRIQR